MRRLVDWVWVEWVLALVLVGCAGPRVGLPPVASRLPVGETSARAGVSKVDITPIPGWSLFGHGPEARVARGHRGRLYCRSLVVIDRRDERFAWVVCDLAAMSELIHRLVAERTVASTGIGADRLLLSATHTHAGPAHYFGARAHSGAFSSQKPGFNQDFARSLADRIARGVMQAFDDAQRGPAALGWQHGTLATGLTRNRSLRPHCLNPKPMPGGVTTCLPDQPDRGDAYAEVDHRLSVLRVERQGRAGQANRLLGLFAVVAMHPTTIPNTNHVYHADVFGVATRLAELELGGDAVVAIANGFEGDVSPAWREQSWAEADRLGRALASEVLREEKAAVPSPAFTVKRVYAEPELPGEPVPCAPSRSLCETGEMGNPVAGGAEDGRTRYWVLPHAREGQEKEDREGCHHPRRAWVGPLLKDRWAFPTFAPLHVVELGNGLVVSLPGEMTTTPGLQLRQMLEALTGQSVVAVGLSNTYLQYFTSRTEYLEQHYEGASVVYGPHSAEFFRGWVLKLARALKTPNPPFPFNHVPKREVQPGYLPRKRPEVGSADGAWRVLLQPFRVEGVVQTVAIEWEGGTPLGDFIGERPLVVVEHFDGHDWAPAVDRDGAQVDDRSERVWVKNRYQWPRRWVAGWAVMPGTATGSYRFKVVGPGVVLRSAEFGVQP